jgi:hypothetical protein
MKRILLFTIALFVLLLPELVPAVFAFFQTGSLAQGDLGGATEQAWTAHGAVRLIDMVIRRPWLLREVLRSVAVFGLLALILRPLAETSYLRLRGTVDAQTTHTSRSARLVPIGLNLGFYVLFAAVLGLYLLIANLLEKKLEHAGAFAHLAVGAPFLLCGLLLFLARDLTIAASATQTARASLSSAVQALRARPTALAAHWLLRAVPGALVLLGAAALPKAGALLMLCQTLALLVKAVLRGNWLEHAQRSGSNAVAGSSVIPR